MLNLMEPKVKESKEIFEFIGPEAPTLFRGATRQATAASLSD
jgi:hypothetical protein